MHPLSRLLLGALLALGTFFVPPATAAGGSDPAPSPSASVAPRSASSDFPVPGGDLLSAIAVYERSILQEKDPLHAGSLLTTARGREVQDRLAATDPDRLTKLFRAAAELKDLHELLLAHTSSAYMRAALVLRKDSELARTPEKLLPWARRWAPKLDEALLAGAVCEWSSLSDEQTSWLSAQGTGERAWKDLSVAERAERLAAWAAPVLGELMKAVPRTPSDYLRLKTRADAIDVHISVAERFALQERLQRARMATDSLVEAEKKLQVLKDPKLRGLLAAAKGSGTLEDTLSKLDALFDGMGETRQDLRWAAPSAPDERLAAQDRAVLASMLRQGMLDYMRGTTAGNRLTAFYAKVPLKIAVRELGLHRLAQFDIADETITFGERALEELARLEGRAPRDLIKDPRLFEQTLKLLSPYFVHEGIHQMQSAWAKKNGVSDPIVQESEIEAMSMDALFTLQKAAADPSFARIHAEKQKFSALARNALHKAESLRRDPARFDDMTRSVFYPQLPSLELDSVAVMDRNVGPRALIRGELARRAGLPWLTRELLEFSGSRRPVRGLDLEGLRTVLRTTKASLLQEELDRLVAAERAAPRAYALWRARYDEVKGEVERELGRLPAPGAPPPPVRKSEPPSPMPAAGKTPPRGNSR